jgi:phosphoribosylamine--glycine ligase
VGADKLNILLVGGGGRENALARALARSPRTGKLIAAPGNPGIAAFAECVPVKASDLDGLLQLARERAVDMVVVGPEQPLADGIADRFAAHNITVAGPRQQAALLESSKVFAKAMMTRLGVPQAEPYHVFDSNDEARRHISAMLDGPVVIKADGLAAGKGVVVAEGRKQALQAVEQMLVEKRFGRAGEQVIVEPCLEGEEASLLFLCDGRRAVPLASARDYKRLQAGDRGPNTGGMGAYSPTPRVDSALVGQVTQMIVKPILAGMSEQGCPYRGVLYCGLMLTAAGPKVLEFNCRFGDPEAQVILPRLKSCLVTLLEQAATGSLADARLDWDDRTTVCVVLASPGYPSKPQTGQLIRGLEGLPTNVFVDHAGTAMRDGRLVTSGGRALSVGAFGANLSEARRLVYDTVGRIECDGVQYRADIGQSAEGVPR